MQKRNPFGKTDGRGLALLFVLPLALVTTGTKCDDSMGPNQPDRVTTRILADAGGMGSGRVIPLQPPTDFTLDCRIANGALVGGTTCTDDFDDAGAGGSFQLEAIADAGSVFAGWTDCDASPAANASCNCTGTGLCGLSFDANVDPVFDVTARFDLISPLTCVDSPLAHWPLDGNAMDVVGAADGPAQLPAGIAAVADHNGVAGAALQFDGTAGLDVGTGTTFDGLALPFSFAGWILHDADSPEFASIFATDNQLARYDGVFTGVVDGKFGIAYGTGGPTAPPFRRSGGAVTIPDGVWIHVVAVVRGPTDMSVYLDGTAVGIALDGTGVGPMTHDPAFGPNIGSWKLVEANEPWKGRLDDLRLYACALDAAEAAALAE
jgi:hypothetical protein